MKCKCGCNKEVVSKGTKPRFFYSDACRKRYNRTNFQEQTDRMNESQAVVSKRTEQTDKPEDCEANETCPICPHNADCDQYIDQPDTSKLPDGVSKPTGQRTTKTSTMTSQQLSASVRACKGVTWIDCPEYAETIYRLLTLTTEELEEQGQAVPCWKAIA